MAPTSIQQVLLSPAELSYLHSSLTLTPPIRPDARTPTQFRPLVAETDILPSTNGSARICFQDGTEAVVGVKAEVEKTPRRPGEGKNEELREKGEDGWLEMSVEIPGFRDDDSMPVFLSSLLTEALLADGEVVRRLRINRRFHWKLCIDILLLSPPLSYPLPLLSLTTHLALLSTRLPKLKSELDEDPLFDDDWEASEFLYVRGVGCARPPATLLVMAVGTNIIFDPCKEELSVADVVLAVSIGEKASPVVEGAMDVDKAKAPRDIRLLAVRTIDPPSRLTAPGVPNFLNTATGGSGEQAGASRDVGETEGVWQVPRGGAKRKMIAAMIGKVLETGGVAEEVLDGLDAVDMG